MEKYDILTTPDDKGCALYRRVRDGKTAQVKTSWFKAAPDGNGLVPRSRTKAIRLGILDWE
jgi:hypothetical protein